MMRRVTVLCGGVGAARFLRALCSVVPAAEVTAVVNTGDDTDLHGLHISPDLDVVFGRRTDPMQAHILHPPILIGPAISEHRIAREPGKA